MEKKCLSFFTIRSAYCSAWICKTFKAISYFSLLSTNPSYRPVFSRSFTSSNHINKEVTRHLIQHTYQTSNTAFIPDIQYSPHTRRDGFFTSWKVLFSDIPLNVLSLCSYHFSHLNQTTTWTHPVSCMEHQTGPSTSGHQQSQQQRNVQPQQHQPPPSFQHPPTQETVLPPPQQRIPRQKQLSAEQQHVIQQLQIQQQLQQNPEQHRAQQQQSQAHSSRAVASWKWFYFLRLVKLLWYTLKMFIRKYPPISSVQTLGLISWGKLLGLRDPAVDHFVFFE